MAGGLFLRFERGRWAMKVVKAVAVLSVLGAGMAFARPSPGEGGWSLETIDTTGSSSFGWAAQAVAMDSDGALHVSYTDVVDGDLRISGNFSWVGIVIVRGRATMVGGGSEKRVIGTLVVGEEVNSEFSSTSVSVSGTVDLLYSSDAIALASNALRIPIVAAWREVANP